jgi:hypothetical protein
MIAPNFRNLKPRIKSYYYLDSGIVEGLMSQFDALPPVEIVREVRQLERQSMQTSNEKQSSLTGSIDSQVKVGAQRSQSSKEEAGTVSDLGNTTTSKYGTAHLFGVAVQLEELLEQYRLSEDFNRRLEEVVNNWQKEVESFSRTARDRYAFDQLAPLLTAASNHTEKLIDTYIKNIKLRWLPNSGSRFLNIRSLDFKWIQDPLSQGRFSFSGKVRVQANLGEKADSFEVCCLQGFGKTEFLDSSAKELISEGNKCEVVEILGKYQQWTNENQIIIQPILIS